MRNKRIVAVLLLVVVTAGCTGAVPGLGGDAGPIGQTPNSAEAVTHVDSDALMSDPATTTIFESISEENPSVSGPEEVGSDFEEEFNIGPSDVSGMVMFTEDVETATGYGEQSFGLIVHGEFDSNDVIDAVREQSTDLQEDEYNGYTLYTESDQSLAGNTAAVAVLDEEGQIVIGDRASVESVIDTAEGDADALSGDLRDEYDSSTDGALSGGAAEFPGEQFAGQSAAGGIDTSVFESVTLALKLDLFATLSDASGPLDADELAARTDTHPDGIGRLCNFLASTNYLERTGDRYRLTGMTKRWLTDAEGTNMGPWLTFWDELVFPFWERELETAVREGEPSQSMYDWFDEEPGRWETAQAGFRATASLLVDDVADAVHLPDGAERLVDVGGGHGLYAMELCRQHPDLAATVFDVPGAVDTLSDEIPLELEDRFSTRAGDYFTDDLGSGYDVALVFNIVHAHDPAENTALFERVADALDAGGRIFVLDQWDGSARTPVSRAGLRFVGLTYLVTLGATVYSHESVEGWLKEAGFKNVTRQSVGPISGQAVVEATKE